VIGRFAKVLELSRSALARWRRRLIADRPTMAVVPVAAPKVYRPLQRVVLADGVLDTLFNDFARHRATARGDEEFGWAILGIREESEAIVVAALPAGAQRHASLTHIQFHSNAQAVAARLLRQRDRRLGMLGVVHTHPGSLRHPSSGDYRGDIRFVARLRGREGVFGIGTADAHGQGPSIERPVPNQHVQGPLCFHWYVLGDGDDNYRKIPVDPSTAADDAGSLTPIWPTLETHADALERLCQQLSGVTLDVAGEGAEARLSVAIALADEPRRLRVLLHRAEARYYVEDGGDLVAVNPDAVAIDQGIYSILAELARQRHSGES